MIAIKFLARLGLLLCLSLGASISAFAGSVNLQWDPAPAPTASSGCTIKAYEISYGSAASGQYTANARTTSGTATTLTVDRLDEGKTYWFAARTVGTCAGTELLSAYSNEVSTSVGIGQPQNLKLALAPTQSSFPTTFPATAMGRRVQKTISIENKGGQKFVVYPRVTGPFVNTQGGQGIPAGGTGRFVVYFAPTEPGLHEGRLELRLADGSDAISWPLTGYAR